MKISEIWALTPERIADFFRSLPDVQACGEGRFVCGACEIRLTPLPQRKAGQFSFPQTQVEFGGPDEETRAIHRRFVVQFISAGG